MYNSVRTFSFLFGYLPMAAVNLKKFQAQKETLSKQEYDALIHTEPQKWAKGILKRTKSRIETSGLENLPEGPALLVANHEGNFDIPVLLSEIPKPFGFISKKEVKKFPVIPVYMEDMNCVFLDRTDRRSAYKSITDTAQKLKDGHSILIFPEGTRSKGEGISDFKTGFVRIAKDAGVPIVPIAIHGTSDIMEKNNNKIRPGHVTIRVLEPILAETVEKTEAKQLIELVRKTVETEVQSMAQEKTDLK
ncbi:lysophospholipid acyltransferase family protein [Planococcus sp. 1R117A]|uniref:lysophospholipid acyltransferase family protein n=1 Tax=Planococcus sp. 1R117A TaxID=3447020 RepID=UPI003EDBE147